MTTTVRWGGIAAGLMLVHALLQPGLGPAGVQAAPAGAGATVERFQQTLIDVMREARTLGFEGRRGRLEPVVRETFDLPFVSRHVLARHWSSLTEAQRDALQRRFVRFAVATLANQFNDYSGERFETGKAQPLTDNVVQVRSLFRVPDGDHTQLDYALHETDAGWQIINVWFDGVSGIRIHREEFSAVIERESVQELMDLLDRKVADMAAGG